MKKFFMEYVRAGSTVSSTRVNSGWAMVLLTIVVMFRIFGYLTDDYIVFCLGGVILGNTGMKILGDNMYRRGRGRGRYSYDEYEYDEEEVPDYSEIDNTQNKENG